ncbi:unnamed protein product [Ixodes persulcatus]
MAAFQFRFLIFLTCKKMYTLKYIPVFFLEFGTKSR